MLEQADALACSAAVRNGLSEVLNTLLNWLLSAIPGVSCIGCFCVRVIFGLDSANPVKASQELELQGVMVQDIALPLFLELLFLDSVDIFIILVIVT